MGVQDFFPPRQIISPCKHTPGIATFENLATECQLSSHFGKGWKNVIEQQGCRTGRSRGEWGGAARAAPTEVHLELISRQFVQPKPILRAPIVPIVFSFSKNPCDS